MVTQGEMWAQLGSAIAGLMVISAMFQQYFPYQLRAYVERYIHKLVSFVYPYVEITFHEYTGERLKRSEAYTAIQNYLGAKSSMGAKRLKADMVKDSHSLVLSMDDHEEVTDEFKGVKLWWASRKNTPKTQSISFYPAADEKRYYKLTFHNRHREIITRFYLKHVLEEGKANEVKNRQRKLYTNVSNKNYYGGYNKTMWSHVVFEHPASFNTLAMESKKKEDIMNDLMTFSKSKEYYAKIGKAWKRGYLLHGPPGTGKSTMIAAMANFLSYDIYDLELTGVKDNTELRKLLIEISSKAIIVIEDIDCSLDLTGQRKKEKEKDGEEEEKDPIAKKAKEAEGDKKSQVTLSGLLNFIDGLWSSCGGERLVVFTTNYLEKLDPALIRRGRMDKHIELSYCCFEAFKELAKNYLDIDSHNLFVTIGQLLEETNMTPADVAENLMPKSSSEDAKICLLNLIQALEEAKEEARLKSEEETKMKTEKEEKERKASAKEEKKSLTKGVKENGVIACLKEEEKNTSANGVKDNGVTA